LGKFNEGKLLNPTYKRLQEEKAVQARNKALDEEVNFAMRADNGDVDIYSAPEYLAFLEALYQMTPHREGGLYCENPSK